MKIPLVDLHAQYLEIADEIDAAIAGVVDVTAFVKGPFVERFEGEFARFVGVPHCVGVGNGTDALFIALKGLGVGPGDEVVTAVNTFVATAEAISMTGARPVFCDVDEQTMNLDPDRIEACLTGATRAIVPVHLFGRFAPMDEILAVARRHGLLVVEDAAQAHGATRGGRRTGSFGDAGTFSFYPGKNLGAYGDGGAIVTANDELAEWVRKFSDHGRATKYGHEFEGINSRLDGLQAAVLSVKLEHLERWSRRRRELAETYVAGLESIDAVICPTLPESGEHVFHLFVVRARRRDALREFLDRRGISTGIHYPQILAELPAYRSAGNALETFPVAAGLTPEILSLPLYPEMGEEGVEIIVEAIRSFYGAC